jgi:hypothetical protein
MHYDSASNSARQTEFTAGNYLRALKWVPAMKLDKKSAAAKSNLCCLEKSVRRSGGQCVLNLLIHQVIGRE